MKKVIVLALTGLLVVAGSGFTYSFNWLDGVQSYQSERPTWGFDSQTYESNYVCPPPPPPQIDIKLGSDPNSINLNSKGVVPVTVLDASTVDDPDTYSFAGADPVRWTMEDVNNDGTDDLVFHFKTQDLELDQDSTEAFLIGDDGSFDAWDWVNIVPKSKK